MEMVLYQTLSGLVGAVVSLAVLALKILPSKVDRKDVAKMLEDQPLHFQVGLMRDLALEDRAELRGIRQEIVGLREDVARQTALLEGLLRNRS
jgi:hypothetical protein